MKFNFDPELYFFLFLSLWFEREKRKWLDFSDKEKNLIWDQF